MIEIYHGVSEDIKKISNDYLESFINFFMDIHKDLAENHEELYLGAFPELVFNSRKDICIKAVEELFFWSRDEYIHTLTPLHEYALYKIIEYCEEADEEFWNENNKGLFFERKHDHKTIFEDFDEETDWTTEDINELRFDFFYDNCFQDFDFLDVPLYYSLFKLMSNTDYKQFRINLNDYIDLMPADIEEEFKNLSKSKSNDNIHSKNFGTIVREGINNFKHSIINYSSYKLLWDNKYEPRGESSVQKLFLVSSSLFYKLNNIDISPESNIGRGPVDFKLSRGANERLLVEVKLARNKKLIHGIEKQLCKYMISEQITEAIYMVVIYLETEFARIEPLKEIIEQCNKTYNLNIELEIINAIKDKPSASNLPKDYNVFL